MNEKPSTPQDLARIIRRRAMTSAPLSDLAAMRRYADWLDEMPIVAPQRPGDRFPNVD